MSTIMILIDGSEMEPNDGILDILKGTKIEDYCTEVSISESILFST